MVVAQRVEKGRDCILIQSSEENPLDGSYYPESLHDRKTEWQFGNPIMEAHLCGMLPRDLEVKICLPSIVQLLRSQLRSHRITMRVPDSRVNRSDSGLIILGSLNPHEILDLQLDTRNAGWALKSAASSPFCDYVISCLVMPTWCQYWYLSELGRKIIGKGKEET